MPVRKYDSDIATGAYPVDLDKPDGQPKVANIISNKTVIVQPVGPADTWGKSGEAVPAPNLAAIVETFRPSIDDFSITTSDDICDTSKASPSTESVPTKMNYGADNASLVMEDFTEEGLISKMQLNIEKPGASEIEKRPLLNQRLQSVAIDDLLQKLTEKDKNQAPGEKDNRFAKMMKNAEQRAGMLAALDEEIARIEALVNQYKLEKAED